MTSQSHTIFGDGIVAQILAFVVVGLALVFGLSDCLVNGPRKPTQKQLEYQKARDDHAQSMRCSKEASAGGENVVDCMKRHGLGGL